MDLKNDTIKKEYKDIAYNKNIDKTFCVSVVPEENSNLKVCIFSLSPLGTIKKY